MPPSPSSTPQPPAPAGPQLSVVVPWVNGIEVLGPTLDALDAQGGDVRIEVLVPARGGEHSRTVPEVDRPRVRVLPMPADASIPALRRRGFDEARGAVVAVLEDHVRVPPDWASTVASVVTADRPVVGGWVFNAASERLLDRAAFLCEYAHMLAPPVTGPADHLTGNHTAYRRDLLERFRAVLEEERWEDRLHDAMREAGVPLHVEARLSAAHDMRYRSAWEYAGQRWLYSRAWAALRLRKRSALARAAYGLAALALPPVLLGRIVRAVWRSPGNRADLVRSLPLQLLFVSAWGVGEAVGAWAGPGDAPGRIR